MNRASNSSRPPAAEQILRLPAAHPPVLLVVIDTEEEFDWSASFDRRNTGVEHMQEIELLQAVFDEFAIRPVYVIDYPIATQRVSSEPLRAIASSGRCEIGAHLHPWVSPPFEEEVNARNSYPGNLPRELEAEKLRRLVRAIEEHLHTRPRCYKAGRYGFGPHTAQLLEELDFAVDLSPCPAFDLTGDGGPDWSQHSAEPFRVAGTRLISIPVTGAFVGYARGAAPALYRFACSKSLAWTRLPGILSRAGALERLMLSPEGYEPEHHRRVTRALLARGVRTFTFSLHSPSIRPGCTPYVRTAADRVQFLDACRRYFDFFFGELGGVTKTARELAQSLESGARKVNA